MNYLVWLNWTVMQTPTHQLSAVTTSEVKEHIAFLRAVHVASSRGKGSLLYADGPALRAAVRAAECFE